MNKTLNLEIGSVVDGRYQVVKFSGDFDKAGHSEIKDQLSACVDHFQAESLLFDFSKLKFINSEGIGVLVEIDAHLVKRGKKLIIIGPNAHVADVFQAVGLKEIMPIFDNISAF